MHRNRIVAMLAIAAVAGALVAGCEVGHAIQRVGIVEAQVKLSQLENLFEEW